MMNLKEENLVINNSYTNGNMTIGANVGNSAFTSIKGSSFLIASKSFFEKLLIIVVLQNS